MGYMTKHRRPLTWLICVSFLAYIHGGYLPSPVVAKPLSPRSETRIETLLPSNTLFFLTIAGRESYMREFRKTSLYQASSQPEVKAFLDDLKGERRRWEKYISEKIDLDVGELLGSIKGDFSLAFVGFSPTEEGPRPNLILSWRVDGADFIERFKTLLENNFKMEKLSMETHLEKDIFRYRKDGVEISFSTIDGLLFLGWGSEGIKEIIDRAEEPSPVNLANNSHFKAISGKVSGPGRIYFFFINMEEILNQFGIFIPPEVYQKLNLLGITSVKAVATASYIDSPGIKSCLTIYAPGDKKGILKPLSFKPIAMEGLRFVPADVDSFSCYRLDLSSLWKEGKELFRALAPEVFQKFQTKVE